jgi:predicted molibdopterin-dependent oxidoreductase YjgC
MIIAASGCPTASFDEFVEQSGKGQVTAAWVTGGYPDPDWAPKELVKAAEQVELLVVQDIFESKLAAAAKILLPSCAFAERAGCFTNVQGRIQPFHPAVRPPDGCRRDGQYLYELAGYSGVYNAARVRELMAATMPQFAEISEAPPLPVHQH